MSVRAIKNHGKRVWQARVAYKGLRKAAFRATKDEARTAEGELLAELKVQANASEAENQSPATLKALFDAYVEDLEARGKGDATIARVATTARVIERVLPELSSPPVPGGYRSFGDCSPNHRNIG